MQVDHAKDTSPEGHEKRQKAEDAETVRVRGPQRPGDTYPAEEPAKPAAPAPAEPKGSKSAAAAGHPVGAMTTKSTQVSQPQGTKDETDRNRKDLGVAPPGADVRTP